MPKVVKLKASATWEEIRSTPSDWDAIGKGGRLRRDEAPIGAFENEAGQHVGGVGAGVDADSVIVDLGPRRQRMAVDDDPSQGVAGEQERVAYPHQIVGVLLGDRNPRPNAGVDE